MDNGEVIPFISRCDVIQYSEKVSNFRFHLQNVLHLKELHFIHLYRFTFSLSLACDVRADVYNSLRMLAAVIYDVSMAT